MPLILPVNKESMSLPVSADSLGYRRTLQSFEVNDIL